MLFAAGVAVFVLRLSPLASAFALLLPAVYTTFWALVGLSLGLKHANLSWTNEIMPIKKSGSVFFVLFGGLGYAALYVLGYLFLGGIGVNFFVFTGAFLLVTAALCLLLYRWLCTRGARLFAAL